LHPEHSEEVEGKVQNPNPRKYYSLKRKRKQAKSSPVTISFGKQKYFKRFRDI